MSIIPIGRLSARERALLGNNIPAPGYRRRPVTRRSGGAKVLAAVNRSLLAIVGERVASLHRPLLIAS